MTNDTKKHDGLSQLATGVAGAVVGAGVAVAASMILKDEKNREKAKEILTNVKDEVVKYATEVQDELKEQGENAEAELKKGEAKAKDLASKAQDEARKLADDGKEKIKSATK